MRFRFDQQPLLLSSNGEFADGIPMMLFSSRRPKLAPLPLHGRGVQEV
jgi:hypothetical protein